MNHLMAIILTALVSLVFGFWFGYSQNKCEKYNLLRYLYDHMNEKGSAANSKWAYMDAFDTACTILLGKYPRIVMHEIKEKK